MERYNPFASEPADPSNPLSSTRDGQDPFAASSITNTNTTTITDRDSTKDCEESSYSRYSTTFPDPLGVAGMTVRKTEPSSPSPSPPPPLSPLKPSKQKSFVQQTRQTSPREAPNSSSATGQRSNSVTFLDRDRNNNFEDDEDEDYDDLDEDSDNISSSFKSSSSIRRVPGRSNLASGTSSSFRHHGNRQSSGGFGSFLYRATSVTSSSVTDRVSGAVGSVRSAVDSISTQIQQVVPVGQLNERLSSVNLAGSPMNGTLSASKIGTGHQQPSQNNLSSPGAGLTSGGGGSQSQLSLISRQRVVLILDATSQLGACDWPQQFVQYRRLLAGLGPASSTSSAITSFFSAQFSANPFSISNESSAAGGDLIEQANYYDISVLANQSSSTAAICLFGSASATNSTTSASAAAAATSTTAPGSSTNPASLLSSPKHSFQQSNINSGGGGGPVGGVQCKIIRPEYVVVKQRAHCGDKFNYLDGVVKALEYCSVPMFEPYGVWHIFQDKQLIFAKLLQVQKILGRECFPLIPQVFCQTHQDLLNYIGNNSQIIQWPCFIRLGPSGGSLKCDNLQMLRSIASIMSNNNLSCTIEQYLDAKCDLVVQRLGDSLKLFKRMIQPAAGQSNSMSAKGDSMTRQQSDMNNLDNMTTTTTTTITKGQRPPEFGHASGRPTATRQTSLGGGVLSSLISSAGQQVSRRSSQPQAAGLAASGANLAGAQYERVSADVSLRYREWIETISKVFGNDLDAFAIKIIVATNDREYIVGLNNCSMNFLGNPENQDEDRKSFVELILNKMNAALPKHSQVSRQSSAMDKQPQQQHQQQQDQALIAKRSTSHDEDRQRLFGTSGGQLLSDKKTASSRLEGAGEQLHATAGKAVSYGQLNNRSKSVSIHQGESFGSSSLSIASERPAPSAGSNLASNQTLGRYYNSFQPARRGSDQTESLTQQDSLNSVILDHHGHNHHSHHHHQQSNNQNSPYQRQYSLGQSLYDQTSTAFSSVKKQSMSFLRRLDAPNLSGTTSGGSRPPSGSVSLSQTPPQSARLAGENFTFSPSTPVSNNSSTPELLTKNNTPIENLSAAKQQQRGAGLKSQSMDCSGMINLGSPKSTSSQRPRPPKPQPPSATVLMNRQSSLASPGHHRSSQQTTNSNSSSNNNNNNINKFGAAEPAGTAPNTTPIHSCQNTATTTTTKDGPSENNNNISEQHQPCEHRPAQQRVVRQNSALSAFEPFDADQRDPIATTSSLLQSVDSSTDHQQQQQQSGDAKAIKKRAGQVAGTTFDSASIKSADSNGTTGGESTTAEDTMNNLKKTFASIFGDKCE